MSGIGDLVWITSLEAEAKQLDEMGDRWQNIILKSPNMGEEAKSKAIHVVALSQKEASEIRMLISKYR